MLRCPRTHGGRESGPGSGVGSRLTGFRCPFRGVSGLDARRRAGRASGVSARRSAISRGEGGREAGCADGWEANREIVTLARAGVVSPARWCRRLVGERALRQWRGWRFPRGPPPCCPKRTSCARTDWRDPASSGMARQVPGSPGHVWRTVVTATMMASSPMIAAVTGGAALPPTASAVPPAAAPSAVAM